MGSLTYTVSGNAAKFKSPDAASIRSMKIYFDPIQSLTNGEQSPSNVCPMTGWTGLNVWKTNNRSIIFRSPVTNTANGLSFTLNANGTISYEGTPTGFSGLYFGDYYVSGGEEIKLCFLGDADNISSDTTFIYDVNGTQLYKSTDDGEIFRQGIDLSNYPTAYRVRLTLKRVSNNVYMKGTITPSLSINGVLQDTMSTVDWSDSPGIIYGGYIDLISGRLVKTYDSYTFTGSQEDGLSYREATTVSGIERYVFVTKKLDYIVKRLSTDTAYSNIANHSLWYESRTGDVLYYIGTPTNQLAIYLKQDMCEPTTESINAWLSEHPIQIVYELETPVEYQLTAQQLQTFIGQNEVWSNAKSVEVEYDLHETNDIVTARKRIIANSPHIATTSGAIANFTTDMASPIKSLKLNFTPVQDLSNGNPSPTNICPISGWSSLKLCNSSSNLLKLKSFTKTAADITYLISNDGSIHISGAATGEAWMGAWQYMFLKQGTYYLSGNTCSYRMYMAGEGHAEEMGSDAKNGGIINIPVDGLYWLQIWTRPADGTIDTTIYPMLEVGSTKGTYTTPYYNENTITWMNTAGTIYGGYVDVAKGILVATYGYKELAIADMNNSENFPGWNYQSWVFDCVDSGTDSRYTAETTIPIYNSFFPYTAINAKHDGILYISRSVYGLTQSQFKEQYPDTVMQVAYKLKTPIEYQLTPQQLLTLRGVNNIWSNTNDITEVSYWTH